MGKTPEAARISPNPRLGELATPLPHGSFAPATSTALANTHQPNAVIGFAYKPRRGAIENGDAPMGIRNRGGGGVRRG